MRKKLWGFILASMLFANTWAPTIAHAAEFDDVQTESIDLEETDTQENVDDSEKELDFKEETTEESEADAELEADTESEVDAELEADTEFEVDEKISAEIEPDEAKIAESAQEDSYDELTTSDEMQDEQGFIVTFADFEGGKIVAYDRQNFAEAVVYDDTDFAVARDSDTGEVDTTGNGQVNFSVVLDEGYSLENVSIIEGEGNYKNLKSISEEKNIYTYRITKITGNLTVSFETKKLEDEDARALLVEELKNALKSYPRYYETYCTSESANALSDVLNAAKALDMNSATGEDIENAINSIADAIANLEYKTAEVPQIYISTENGKGNSLVKETGYVNTAIVIADGNSTFADEAASIKVRGNTTALGEKKPFNIKLSSKQDLFGMGSSKKWCLLANCFDPTLLRNYTALALAKEMGIPYTSENCFVDLWLDGVYKGSYLFTEAVEAGKTRVDIDVKNGDFILEYEKSRVEDGTTYITNDNGLRFSFKEPEEPSEAQYASVKASLDRITSIIDSGDYSEVEKNLNIDSFAKFYVLNEYMKTIDFKFSSVYFFYKDGIFYAGPAWDFDLSSGNGKDNSSAQRDYKGAWANSANIFPYLMKYREFQKEVKRVLDQYSGYISNIGADGGFIDTAYGTYKASFDRNFNEAGWDVSKKYSNNMMTPFATFDENVNYLKSFLYNRYNWMQEYYGKLVPEDAVDLQIIRQPSDIVVNKERNNAVFSIEAAGNNLNYMWYIKTPASNRFIKSGVNSSEYTVCMYEKNNGIQAYCVITDGSGNKVTSATATASIAPVFEIVKDTEDVVAGKHGDKCTFSIEVRGSGIEYSWYCKKTEITGGDGKFHKAGCYTNEYTRTASEKIDGMQVYCVVTNSEGKKLVGRTATFTMAKNQVTISYPNGKEIVAAAGKKANFKVSVSPDNVTYSWYCMVPVQSGGDGSFHKAGCYTDEYIRSASARIDGMQAYCLITDSMGKKVKSDIITLDVQ